MVFPIAGGTQDTSYEISNSLMFEDGDGADLSRTPSANGNRKTFTFSAWLKIGNIPTADYDFFSANTTNNFNDVMRIRSDESLQISATVSGDNSNGYKFRSDMKFRDPSAWYHIVVAVDTTQATNSNGLKIYVNGSLISGTYDSYNQNISTSFNKDGSTMSIGHRENDGGNHYDGYISETHFIDGSQLDSSYFGKTDNNGVWVPKQYTGSYGTNGFFLEFKQTGTGQNSSGIGADTSGNDNHFTPTNLAAIDVITDTPTNNFAVLNSAANLQNGTVSQGNTKLVTHGGTSNNSLTPGTIGVQNGKWYVEVYFDSTNYPATGIMPDDTITDVKAGTGSNNSVYLGKSGSLSRFLRYDGQKSSSNSNSTYMAAVNGGDKVVQIALNMDDGQITFGANGQWANGSGSTNQTFSNSTAAFTDINSSGDYTDKFAMFIFADENYGTSDVLLTNFGGCPPYAISGTVYSDANGYGKFKYEVPSGYYSVCTKNLAEFG